jgi:hypothetical protein
VTASTIPAKSFLVISQQIRTAIEQRRTMLLFDFTLLDCFVKRINILFRCSS